MKRQCDKRVVYYDDEGNDDFFELGIKERVVDEGFSYVRRNIFYRVFSFLLYYVVAIPLVWFFERVILGVRFVNKKGIRKCRSYCFLYGNHTGWVDAFTPCLISFPRRNSVVVSADTVSINGLKTVVQMLGAIPVPTTFRAIRKFNEAVDYSHGRSNVTVYPEAHIWPYFNGVRNFPDTSFEYPVRNGAPVIAFFTAYTKPKGLLSVFRKANMTVYVSDPIYPDEGLVGAEARRNLRDKVYEFMLDKSRYSDYSVVEYKRRTKEGA